MTKRRKPMGLVSRWGLVLLVPLALTSALMCRSSPGQGLTPPRDSMAYPDVHLDAGGTPAGRLDALSFSRDWIPGSRDGSGRLMTGTETLWLVVHQGMLFAGLGVWNLDPAAENPGATVLVKVAAGAGWETDGAFGPTTVRVSALSSLTLTHDGGGQALAMPVTLLLAGVRGTVHVRNDQTGAWVASPLPGPPSEIRHLFAHRDRLTGADAVFAALSNGRIMRAVYNPTAAGGLLWDTKPELDSQGGRIMSAVEFLDHAFVAVDLSTKRPDKGGLFRRVDGPSPVWERIGAWGKPPTSGIDASGAWLRGLTPVPDPAHASSQVMLAGREAQGVVERISLGQDGMAVVTQDQDVYQLLSSHWGVSPSIRYILIAYNDMPSVVDPASAGWVNLLGLGMQTPATLAPALQRSGWYLVRDQSGKYRVGRVPELQAATPPPDNGLRAVRTIVPSPFQSERERVCYFGGFDAARGPHTNTAWIYRGALSQ